MDTKTATQTKPIATQLPRPQACPECRAVGTNHAPNCTIGKSMQKMPAAPVHPEPPKPEPKTEAPAPGPVAESPMPVVELAEAPFSWNTYAEDAAGWSEQFTVRATDSTTFVREINGVKKFLADNGYHPAQRGRGFAAAPVIESAGEETPKCAIHKTPMSKRQGKNGSFWSCATKLDDGTWCPYRPPTK